MRALPALLLLCACESGLSRSVKLVIPQEVASRFSPASPGIVVSDLGARPSLYVVLCGQSLKNPVYLSQDLGFGCLDTRNGTEETVRVWVDPQPLAIDAGVTCSVQREFYSALSLTATDGGTVLAADPDPAWSQGLTTATWRRDGSPCGGVLNAELALTP